MGEGEGGRQKQEKEPPFITLTEMTRELHSSLVVIKLVWDRQGEYK